VAEREAELQATRAEDVARLIMETRSGSRPEFLGVWGVWFGIVALLSLLAGNPWVAAVAAVAAWQCRTLGARADAASTALLLPNVEGASLGVLMELLHWPSARVRDAARWLVTTRLRSLDPNRVTAPTRVQLANLYDVLTPWAAQWHPDFVEAVLLALPLIGNQRAIPAVTRLVKMTRWTRRLRRISSIACAVLPATERRVLAQREAAGTASGDAAHDVGGVLDTPRRAFGDELGLRPQMRLGFLIAVWLLIVPFGTARAVGLALEGAWLDALLFAVPVAISTQLHRLTMMGRHAKLARELMKEERIEAIGRLAEAATWPDPRVRAAAVSALTRLLPRLKASDSGMLTSAQRTCLHSFLNRTAAQAHPELVTALLTALEQVGDLAAVPFVRGLADMRDSSARMSAVRDAARECLPVLLERARGNTDHQTLLRPAQAPGPPAETLVRPAMPSHADDTGLLVRPASPDADA
jgi:HEAT repeat protein